MTREMKVIGLMSGTSLDGVDLAACSFTRNVNGWQYGIHYTHTIPYSPAWRQKLETAHQLTPVELDALDEEYGDYLAEIILETLAREDLHPGLIASHGHTVFHEPEKGITRQIGSGIRLHAKTGIPVVYDFRSLDVKKGGQGAPLVPVGDRLLFGDYDACLNLGGFSNISFDHEKRRIAFDICPVNIVLNHLASRVGKTYDNNGELGRKGRVVPELLRDLEQLEYYQMTPPKSLAREWLETNFLPLLQRSSCSLEDKAATVYEHISRRLMATIKKYGITSVLLTGGGALNQYLISLLRQSGKVEIILPDRKLIDYKEAIIFAFLGLLRLKGEINCYASVTGAREDSVAGVLIKKEPRNDRGSTLTKNNLITN